MAFMLSVLILPTIYLSLSLTIERKSILEAVLFPGLNHHSR